MKKSVRPAIIAGNWKMNGLPSTVEGFARRLAAQIEPSENVRFSVCPPFVCLPEAVRCFNGGVVEVGAQNMHEAQSGAYTGEVSAQMLTEIGVNWVILGHSERRQYFGETDAAVAAKVRSALAAGLHPIVCVGETAEEREAGSAEGKVVAQLRAAFEGLEPQSAALCVTAYEPIWAIGTGNTATPEQAGAMCAAIRNALAELCGAETAERMAVLYGGSMNTGNAAELLAQEDIDGGLIGGASLKPDDLAGIYRIACEG